MKLTNLLTKILKKIATTSGKLAIYIVISLIFWKCMDFVCSPVHASGESMMPTCKPGVWYYNTLKVQQQETPVELKRGDIIGFIVPGTENKVNIGNKFMKRIVAVPGDEVQIVDGYLYVNGEFSEFNFQRIDDAGIFKEALTVPEGNYVGMGDNRNNSHDSRAFGFIPYENIKYLVNTENEWSIWHPFTFGHKNQEV